MVDGSEIINIMIEPIIDFYWSIYALSELLYRDYGIQIPQEYLGLACVLLALAAFLFVNYLAYKVICYFVSKLISLFFRG